jgi:3',5'-cyclic-AMP phosphodiesterase
MLTPDTTSIETVDHVAYLYAAKGGGAVAKGLLAVTVCPTDGLPDELNGVILTADLQGRELLPPTKNNPTAPSRALREGDRLLGQVVAARLTELSAQGRLPAGDRLGVILAGDLWAIPGCTRRGGRGDVRPVWEAFRSGRRWVAGVRGNHDVFVPRPTDAADGLHVLNGTTVQLDGLTIGGVGGVICHSGKPESLRAEKFLDKLREATAGGVDMLVTHAGPDGATPDLRGSAEIRAAVAGLAGRLMVFGHCHWHAPVEQMPGGPLLLNVDSRVSVLVRKEWRPSGGTPPEAGP